MIAVPGRRARVIIGACLWITTCQGGAAAQPAGAVEVVPVVPHTRWIWSVAVAAGGRFVAAASGSIKLWDPRSGRLLRTLQADNESADAVAVSSDARLVLSGGRRTMVLWDAATGARLHAFHGHGADVRAVALSPDSTLALSGACDGVRLWDVGTGRELRRLQRDEQGRASGDPGTTRCAGTVRFSPDATLALSASADDLDATARTPATIDIWDVRTGRQLHSLAGGTDDTMDAVFALDGRSVFLTDGANLKLWRPGETQASVLASDPEGMFGIALSPDGLVAATRNQDVVRLWDARTGTALRSIDFGWVSAMAFSDDGALLQVGGAGGRMRLYDVATGQAVQTYDKPSPSVNTIALSPDGRHLLAGGDSDAVNVWDTVTGQVTQTFEAASTVVSDVSYAVDGLAFSADGGRVLIARRDGLANEVRSFPGGQLLGSPGHPQRDGLLLRNTRVLAADGRRLLLGHPHERIIEWRDVASGAVLRRYEGGPFFAVSPRGDLLVAASPVKDDPDLDLRDAATGAVLRRLSGHPLGTFTIRFSPDGSRVAIGGVKAIGTDHHNLHLRDVASGAVVRTFGHGHTVRAVAFSPDATTMASAAEHSIKLWDAQTGRLLRELHGHTGEVRQLLFSSDGKRIVSASEDSRINIWNAETADLLLSLVGAENGQWLAITPEGFFAASESGAALISVVRGLDVYAIDQLFQSLYRPDLVREKLAGDPHGAVRRAAADLSLNSVFASGLPPRVTRFSQRPGGGPRDQATMEVEILDQGGGIGRIEWRVNGVTVGVEDMGGRRAPDPVRLTRTLLLDPGENEIQVTAYGGRDLIASLPARARIDAPTGAAQAPRLFVLAVGINGYAEPSLELSHAVADATAVAQGLAGAGRDLYRATEVMVLRDAEVRRSRLDAAFTELAAKVQPGDMFVFFAAGHGKTVDGGYYFVPQDFRFGDATPDSLDRVIAEQGISQQQWQSWFSRIAARRSLLMFDTCESGTLAGDAWSVQSLERAGAVDRFVQATGRSLLTATTGDADAREGYRGHGLFTYQLLDALERGDGDGNGTVEAAELASYVHASVLAASEQAFNVRQVPQVRVTLNYPLARATRVLRQAPPSVDVPAIATHQLTLAADLHVVPQVGARKIRRLDARTPVVPVESQSGWSLIAQRGRLLGYVPSRYLAPVR